MKIEDRVMDLEDALDELKAEFDALMAGEEGEEEHDMEMDLDSDEADEEDAVGKENMNRVGDAGWGENVVLKLMQQGERGTACVARAPERVEMIAKPCADDHSEEEEGCSGHDRDEPKIDRKTQYQAFTDAPEVADERQAVDHAVTCEPASDGRRNAAPIVTHPSRRQNGRVQGGHGHGAQAACHGQEEMGRNPDRLPGLRSPSF